MNYHLKKAVITASRDINKGNFFSVRVLPQLSEIKETNLLPAYANFFSTDNLAYNPNDEVWVVCSEDFRIGFILGLSQPPAGENITSFIQLVNSAEQMAGFDLSGYDELSVTRVGGTSFSFENVNNGQSGVIYQNRFMSLISQFGDMWIQNPTTKINISKRGEFSIYGTSKDETYTGDITVSSASITEKTGGRRIEASGSVTISASGDFQNVTASNKMDYTTGNSEEMVAKKKKETYGTGKETNIVSGGDTNLVLVGDYKLTTVAGKVNISASLGAEITSVGPMKFTASYLTLSAPIIKVPTGTVIPGSGPLNCVVTCPFAGIPHTGNMMIGG